MRRRIRLLLMEKHALMVGAVGAGIAAVLLALSKWSFSLGEPVLLIGIILGSIMIGAVWGAMRRLTSYDVARAAERRLDIKERLSSAVALARTDDEMVRALVEDATEHVQGIQPKGVFPHRFTREMMIFGIMLLSVLVLYFIPLIPSLQSPTRRQEVQIMAKEGKRLIKLAKEAKEHVSTENKAAMERLAKDMELLGKKLKSGRMTRKQAMQAINKLDKKVKDAQDRIAAQNRSPKSMAAAAKDMEEFAGALAKNMQERIEKQMQENLATGKIDPKLADLEKRLKNIQSQSDKKTQEMESQVQKYLDSKSGAEVPPELSALMSQLLQNEDYKKSSELMSKLARKLGQGNMSKEDMKNIEEQLKAMAEALKGTDLNELAKQMRQAAEQLAKMDPKEAAKMLAQAQKAGMNAFDKRMLGKMSGG
jgi:DNA repair exonuclease SbcCD ATPase subunit